MQRTVKTGRPSRREAEALGDHVLAVADRLFVERGYDATSMAMIAAEARVGKQTLYSRFSEKAVVFREVVRRRIGHLADVPTSAPAEGTALNELKELGRSALKIVLDPEFIRLYRIVIAEAIPFPELACAAAENWDFCFGDRSAEIIRKAQESGQCREGDPQILAQHFIWSLTGQALFAGLSGTGSPVSAECADAHLERIWQLTLNGLAPDPVQMASTSVE